MVFQPLPIPLTDGQRDDLSPIAGEPSALVTAQNVVFTKKGAIRGRPGTVNHGTETIVMDDLATAGRTTTLTGATSSAFGVPGYTANAPCKRVTAGGDSLLLACHGRLLERAIGNPQWYDRGPLWSLKRTNRPMPPTFTNGGIADNYYTSVSRHLVGLPWAALVPGLTWPCPVYDDRGNLAGPTQTDFTGAPSSIACANTGLLDVAFYSDSTGSPHLRCLAVPTGGTAAADTSLAADMKVSGTPQDQYIWACSDGTAFYVAYATTTAGQVKVLKITFSGTTPTISATATYGLTDAVQSVGLGVGNGSGVLIVTNSVNTTVRTRVFALSNMADSAINVDLTDTGTAGQAFGAVCGVVQDLAGAYTAYFAWHNQGSSTGGNLCIGHRTLNSASGAIVRTLAGADFSGTAGQPGVQWRTMFPPTQVMNRPLLGVARSKLTGGWTWMVLDIALSTIDRFCSVAAAGANEDCDMGRRPGTSALLPDGSLLFAIVEGITFNTQGVVNKNTRPIVLTPMAPQYAQTNDLVHFGGCQSYVFDGGRCFEAGFPGGSPGIATVKSAGGGLTVSASYTMQSVWVHIDEAGNQHRSPASLPATASTDNAGNKTITWVADIPQVTSRLRQTVWLEVYSTAANPSAGAPLYLISRTVVSATAATMTGSLGAEPDQTVQQLYTEGNVVNDERPPAGDRGIALAGGRLWVAGERAVYCSKVPRDKIAPAWYTGGFLTVTIPASVGAVTALAGMDDKLVVIGTGGTAVVYGTGYDDLGNGSGFALQVVHPEGNAAGARAATMTPQGVAWLAGDGLVRLLSRGLSAQIISRPLQVQDASMTDSSVIFVPPAVSIGVDSITDQLLLVGDGVNFSPGQRLLDLETGQWAQITGSFTHWVALNGVLWGSTGTSGVIASFETADGADAGVPFVALVQTRPARLSQSGSALTWGRVRRVRVLGQYLGIDFTQTVQLLADDQLVQIASKNQSITSSAFSNWPYSAAVEAFATQQRAATVSVVLQATPGVVQWDQIELWADLGSVEAPARQRG